MDIPTLVVIAAHKAGGYAELSKALGVGRSAIWRWKMGETKPKRMAIKCLCDLTEGIVTTDMIEKEKSK